MPKYLFQASYTSDGVKGLLKEGGSGRRTAVTSAVEKLGGTLEGLYFAFGDTDVYLVVDMPDNASVTALALATAASGAVTSKTTVLLTPEEVDDAARKNVAYRAPGEKVQAKAQAKKKK
jgi:uncharacterized protein with GYD domain